MPTLKCFVMIDSGEDPKMRLSADGEDGLCRVPTTCTAPSEAIEINCEDVYTYIIQGAVNAVNAAHAHDIEPFKIECVRAKDSLLGGDMVTQFVEQICTADITIADVTGLIPTFFWNSESG